MAWISTSFSSKILKMPVEVELLAPWPGSGVQGRKAGWKVIILLHGEGADRTQWLLQSCIPDLVKKLPILVCMPSGKNSSFLNTENGYDYMDYVIEELPAWLQSLFSVSPNRGDWMIAGAGTGGYGALACGLRCPKQFGKIAVLGEGAGEKAGEEMERLYRELPEAQRPGIYRCREGRDFSDWNLRLPGMLDWFLGEEAAL